MVPLNFGNGTVRKIVFIRLDYIQINHIALIKKVKTYIVVSFLHEKHTIQI